MNCCLYRHLLDLNRFHGIYKERDDDFIVQELDEDGEPVVLGQFIDIDISQLYQLVSENDVYQIQEYLDEMKNNCDINKEFILKETFSKETRKQIHAILNSVSPEYRTTTNEDGYIILYHKKNKKYQKRDNNRQWTFKDKLYLEFTLQKKGIDTLSALDLLSKQLKRKNNIFTYKGIKDKNAITTQKIRAYKVTHHELINSVSTNKSIAVSDFKYVSQPFSTSLSTGNQFYIKCRHISPKPLSSVLALFTMGLSTMGFINYYGLQRFGLAEKEGFSSDSIGLSILRNNYQEVIEKLLDESIHPLFAYSYSLYKQGIKQNKAIDVIPIQFQQERQIISSLYTSKGNYLTAFASISLQKRLFYIHSFQSLLFNKMASFRISSFWNKTIPGDFIIQDSESTIKINNTNTPNYMPSISILNKDNYTKYTMDKIVLPIPGQYTQIPAYMSSYYSKLLNDYNLSSNCWSECIQEYRMSGTYRNIIKIPSNLKITSTTENDDSIINLSFSLGSGCYATMLLRELIEIK
ncbi:hypothetical protein WA158_005235 [Blastocystis sp. Blastoise]